MFYKKNRFWILFLFVILAFTLFRCFTENAFASSEEFVSDDDYSDLILTMKSFYNKDTASDAYNELRRLVKTKSNIQYIDPMENGWTVSFKNGPIFTAKTVVENKRAKMVVKKQAVKKGKSKLPQISQVEWTNFMEDDGLIDDARDDNGQLDPSICDDYEDAYFTMGGGTSKRGRPGCFGSPFSQDPWWEVYTKQSANTVDPKAPKDEKDKNGKVTKVIDAQNYCKNTYPKNTYKHYIAKKGVKKGAGEWCAWYAIPKYAPDSDPQDMCGKIAEGKSGHEFISQQHTNGMCLWVPAVDKDGNEAPVKLSANLEWAKAQRGE